MQLRTYSVADKIPYHRVAARLDIPLDRAANIPNAGPGLGGLDALKEAFACDIHKALGFLAYIPTREGICIVAIKSLVKGASVNADNVALLEDNLLMGYAVDHHIVYRDTCAARKTAVTKEVGLSALFLDRAADNAVDLPGGNPGFDRFASQLQCFRRDPARFPHNCELAAGFKHNHGYASNAANVSLVVSATSS